MKAILVGRHNLSGKEGLEVVVQENINFPAASNECRPLVYKLLQKAKLANASLVFQMMPGQLAVCCADLIDEDVEYKIGVIVNKPGERLSGIKREFYAYNHTDGCDFNSVIIDAVKFANPRAKIKEAVGIEVEVDPPLRFEFSHIEWF